MYCYTNNTSLNQVSLKLRSLIHKFMPSIFEMQDYLGRPSPLKNLEDLEQFEIAAKAGSDLGFKWLKRIEEEEKRVLASQATEPAVDVHHISGVGELLVPVNTKKSDPDLELTHLSTIFVLLHVIFLSR
ncbi:hypothetical protein Leryth_022899 [Lithospermum erythrorhizon]|nr:hypothetical protein Leryth_022899 [Lithospermum erythrorhizon]